MTGIVIGFTACKKGSSPVMPIAPVVACDRKITITVDNSTPPIGTNVTFTLVAGNLGPDATTGVSVSDILPAGYTFVSATPTTGSYAAGVWSGFGLVNGGNSTLTIIATVNAAGNHANTAAITGIENDPVAGNNSSTVSITPIAPKILMVSTLAGGSFGNKDGTGAAASFASPEGIAVDAAGNVYVADHSNDCIRKITPAGVVTTLAGSVTGLQDGSGVAAKFNAPSSVAVDAGGNVYVADAGNNRIRKITPAGMVSTIAGSGYVSAIYQPLGVGVDAAGNVYVADTYNNRILKLSSGGSSLLAGSATGGPGSAGYADGTGAAARFDTPNGVVVDAAGNVYVTDPGNHALRKITPAGVVTTIAGGVQGFANGTGPAAQFNNLCGPAIDAAGNIFIADIGTNSVRKITPAGVVTTVAGSQTHDHVDGPVGTASFSNPFAVAVDAAGNIYVSDKDNNAIRKIGFTLP